MDNLSPKERSERMSRIRGKDTRAELAVRGLLHAMGYRFRLHDKELPGRPDIVFRPRQKVVFIHGCFWHRHPGRHCRLARLPKSRLDFWRTKLEHNRRRDLTNQRQLRRLGWRFLIVWECQIRNQERLAQRLRKFLDGEAK